jgi:hypothetical protein
MLIPFGVLSAAGAGGAVVPPAFELISTTVLGTATSSVSFSSLGDYSSTYKHLQIRYTGRNTSEISRDLGIRFNDITSSSYAGHRLLGVSTTASSSANTSDTRIFVERGLTLASTANSFAAGVVDVLDPYSATKNTTVRALVGLADGTQGAVSLASGFLDNTASITSIQLFATSQNLAVGSRFSLYGIRG